MFKTKNFFIL